MTLIERKKTIGELTEEEKIDKQVEDLRHHIQIFYDMLNQRHRFIFKLFWSNPKKIAERMGNGDTLDLFQLSSGLQSILYKADPKYEPLVPDRPVEIKDGIVTIGDLPEPEEEQPVPPVEEENN